MPGRFRLICLCVLVGLPVRAVAADGGLLIPGGTAQLLQAAGIRAPVEPQRALLVVVRSLYGLRSLSSPTSVRLAAYLANAAKSERAGEEVAALLPAPVWERWVFGQAVGAGGLAARIIADRKAALLYYGLFGLDEETLAYFVKHPALVKTIHADHSAVFAVFSESISIRGGQVGLPGTASAAAAWEALVGAPRTAPERFVPNLLGRDRGRLAWLFDTLSRLDGPHRAFALGRNADELRDLSASFGLVGGWNIPETPFVRLSSLDADMILQRIAVTPDGQMAAPRERGLWQAAFDRHKRGGRAGGPVNTDSSPVTEDAEVSASWLLQRFLAIPAVARRAYLDSVLFAQRLAASDPGRTAANLDALAEVLAAFPTHEALMVTLERIGSSDPRDYQRVLRAAQAVAAGDDQVHQVLRLAMFQASLVLIDRLHATGVLGAADARALCASLSSITWADDAAYAGAFETWIRTNLMAALPPPQRSDTRTGLGDPQHPAAEGRLVEALAGIGVQHLVPVIEWEDRRYRVDVAAAECARLSRIRERQGGPTLDDALDLARIISDITAGSTPSLVRSRATQLATLVAALIPGDRVRLFGIDMTRVRESTLAMSRELSEGRVNHTSPDVRRCFAAALGVVLADVLASHAYAIALGDPDGALLLGENLARRHDFAIFPGAKGGPWTMASAMRSGAGPAASGSLLGLERAFAVHWMRPASLGAPRARPLLWEQEGQGLAESVAGLNPFELSDGSRDACAETLRRGRERLAEAARSGQLDAVMENLGVEGWRRRLVRTVSPANPRAVEQYLSLAEVLALGAAATPAVHEAVPMTAPPAPPSDSTDRGAPIAPPLALPSEGVDAWGPSRRAIDGSLKLAVPSRLDWHETAGRRGLGLLGSQVADLQLRVAEVLAELRLPAGLAAGVLSYAMWDLAMTAEMADMDDWLAVVRASQSLTSARIADYVSALAAGGPLVRVDTRRP